ncbi:hypothetical protein [Streptomyces sp. NPDC058084]|uniref:hypothetical protein n=1 Tax=Streptomyces sp. NPDC058084 TaxID=3346333 RepID=UPI0036E84DA0
MAAVVLGLGLALGACSAGGDGGTPPKPKAPRSAPPTTAAPPTPSATPSADAAPTRDPAASATPSPVRVTPGVGGRSAKPYRPGDSGGVRKKTAAEPQNPYAGPNPPPAPDRPEPPPYTPPPAYQPGDPVTVVPVPTFEQAPFTPDTVR